MKTLALILALALCVGCSRVLVTVRVIRIEHAIPGFSGHSDYTIVERTDTHERLLVVGIPGGPGETITIPESGLHHFSD